MRRRTSAFLVIVPLVVLVDQVVKLIVQAVFNPGQELEVIPGLFTLVFWTNNGIAFGLLSSSPGHAKPAVLAAISLLAVVVMAYVYFKEDSSRPGALGLLLVIGGALGNAIDRVFFGQVVDYLSFHYRSFSWPAFNIADSCITVGIAMVIVFDLLLPLIRRFRAPHSS